MTQPHQPPSAPKARALRRRLLLSLLYALDVSQTQSPQDVFRLSRESIDDVDEAQLDAVWDELGQAIQSLWSKRAELDEQIVALSPRWRIERMATIDRNLLRLGIWSILEQNDAPIVVVNDCIELAKRYGGKGSPAFINGLLDQLCRDRDIPMR